MWEKGGGGGNLFYYCVYNITIHDLVTNYCKHFPQSICREFVSPVGYLSVPLSYNFLKKWNKLVEYHMFKMETLQNILKLVKPNAQCMWPQ